MTNSLSLARLESAVSGGVSAIRSRSRLQPAGGPGDKVFPPTYATGDRQLRYAKETRRIDGEDVDCILLDSVQSQANRMEEALLRAWEGDGLPFPVIGVDFTGDHDLLDLDRISSLQAPHRVYDALLRDSVSDGKLFRDTELGKAITDATWRNATALYRVCPTALIFGAWDSTGPKGGLGTKFQRALVSEILAVRAVPGAKTSSRLDPAAVEKGATVFHDAKDPRDWTPDEESALKDNKNNPRPFNRKGVDAKSDKELGKPSGVNHGNVTPSIDTFAGGVTFDYALQTVVLSLPALRRLRFQTTVDDKRLEGEERTKAEHAARTALAALGLSAMVCLREDGFDLRSRCTLVPESVFSLELVPAEGGEPELVTMTPTEAKQLLVDAHKKAKEHGFGWDREPMKLTPAPKLAMLIKKSRALAAAGTAIDDDA